MSLTLRHVRPPPEPDLRCARQIAATWETRLPRTLAGFARPWVRTARTSWPHVVYSYIICTYMTYDLSRRFGFLVAQVAKLYGELFDAMARERIGLSRAQCRLLGALA